VTQIQEVSSALCSLLAHPQEAVGVVAGRLASADLSALSEMWTAPLPAAPAAAAAASIQQTSA